jgi:transcription antitermination factor NusA-like protein
VGKTIKAGIQLVARMDTVAQWGLRIHKRWLQRKIQMGEETIYIRAMGNENIDLARHLAQWAQQEGIIEIVRSQTFVAPTRSGNPQRAVVITGHSTQAKAELTLDPEEEVQAVLVRHIPPIALGQVEVLDIVREPRIQCKVVVRPMKSDCDPVQVCLGSDKQYVQAVSSELQESIWFVPWSENPEEFLLNCLGINRNNLYSIKIDYQQRVAEVIVSDNVSAAKAVGTKGTNVRLAEKITGLTIEVFKLGPDGEKTKSRLTSTPEDELLVIVNNHIPEIASGAIRVVDVARDVGIQSKVVIQNVSSTGDPLKICNGYDQRIVLGIKDELGEPVWFVKWDENPNKFLTNCLGIRWYELITATIDQALHTAQVVVKDDMTAARAIGENGINVKQARQLTHLRKIRILHEKQE